MCILLQYINENSNLQLIILLFFILLSLFLYKCTTQKIKIPFSFKVLSEKIRFKICICFLIKHNLRVTKKKEQIDLLSNFGLQNNKLEIMKVDLSSPQKTNISQAELKGRSLSTPLDDSSFILFGVEKSKKEIIERLMSLQGECKIDSYEFLEFNLIKTILLMIPIIVTVFGLFVLKYYACFRSWVFYSQSKREEATHLMIKNNEGNEQIVKIDDKEEPLKFTYKKLKYILYDSQTIPIGLKFQQKFDGLFDGKYRLNGLDSEEVERSKYIYGTNEHSVSIPSFPEYLLDILTTPFFLLQYVFCFVYFIQGYAAFSIALLFFSVLTTAINYIMMYISYNRIKSIAQRHFKVRVLREGQFEEIDNVDLVPGDVFEPQTEIPCDALVLTGDIYVNEANLTGESYPIGKFPVTTLESTEQNNTWLFQGSKVLETRPNSLAIVINIGFQTCRGRIIRKILTRERRQPDLFRSAIIFVLEVVIISIITFCSCLFYIVEIDAEPIFYMFKIFDFLGSAAPPPLPIFFNVAYSFALTRLSMKDISGTEPQQTVNGAYTKILCFDKTGTLTQTQVQIRKIYAISGENLDEVTDNIHEPFYNLIMKLFASCHTVKEIGEQLLGDEIDKEMFVASKYKMSHSSNQSIKFIAQNEDHNLEILRINQFQSKFQSMSVLIRDTKENKFYVFMKGAPEKVINNSLNKNDKFLQMVKELSFCGLRTIGFAYKRISEEEVSKYLVCPRDQYTMNMSALGLVAFDNKLKSDVQQTMEKLYESNIEPKMITGDNIYIAIETAGRAGIIRKDEPVLLLEGWKQEKMSSESMEKIYSAIQIKKQGGLVSHECIKIGSEELMSTKKVIAIDGAFLNLEPNSPIPSFASIFARIPPEDKAKIIKMFKAKIKQIRSQNQGKFARFLKINKLKVGMCGDGANDLLALRQADLSLGIQESDASYGSSFTIKNLLDTDQILRESKNTQANIIQLLEYYTSASFFNVLCSAIILRDSTYYSSAQLMFLNFAVLLIFPITFAVSRPAEQSTRFVPDSNFMGLHNHLIYWGNVLIPTAGVIGGYYFYKSTDEFQPNPKPKITITDGFYSQNHSATIVFLMVLIPFAFNALFIYSSSPWKEKFYRNIPFLIVFICNSIVAIVFFFSTSSLKNTFQMVVVSYEYAAIVLGITLGCAVLNFLYNLFIRSFQLDHRVLQLQY